MKFFKPEDFIEFCNYGDVNEQPLNEILADLANKKLDHGGMLVYKHYGGSMWRHRDDVTVSQATESALLINIRPIGKCQHLPDKIRKLCQSNSLDIEYLCECGARVKPVKFEVSGG